MAAKIDDRVMAFFGIALNTVGIYRDDGAVEEATCHRDATLSPSARPPASRLTRRQMLRRGLPWSAVVPPFLTVPLLPPCRAALAV